MTWDDLKDLLEQEAAEKGDTLTKEFLAEQKKVFDAVDTNKDGFVTVKEMDAYEAKLAKFGTI